MSKPTCASCIYYDAGTSRAFPDVDGMCRRYAPQGPVIGHSSGWQLFPPMMAYQWCGEHRPLPAATASAAERIAA